MAFIQCLNDAKAKFAAESFADALVICEKALVYDEAKSSFALYSLHALVASQLNIYEKAEKSFIQASKLEANPQLHQKNSKCLADLYEKFEKWNNHAEALTKLYEVMRQKRNFDRLLSLAENISSSYLKAKSYSNGGKFIYNHILYLEDQFPQHSVEMIIILYRYQQLYSEHAATSEKKSSMMSIGSISSIKKQTNSEEENEQLKWLDLNTILILLLKVLDAAPSYYQNSDILRILCYYYSNTFRWVHYEIYIDSNHLSTKSTLIDVIKDKKLIDDIKYTFETKYDYIYGVISHTVLEICDTLRVCTEDGISDTDTVLLKKMYVSIFLNQMLPYCIERWFTLDTLNATLVTTGVDDVLLQDVRRYVEGYYTSVLTMPTLDGEKVIDTVLSSSTTVKALVYSAYVLSAVESGHFHALLQIYPTVIPIWLDLILQLSFSHDNVSNNTMKAPVSSVPKTPSLGELISSHRMMSETLILCTSLIAGIVMEFRTFSIQQMLYSTKEALRRCHTLHVGTSVSTSTSVGISKSGKSDDHANRRCSLLRGHMLECVRLARIRSLVLADQIDVALNESVEISLLVSEKGDNEFVVNLSYIDIYLNSFLMQRFLVGTLLELHLYVQGAEICTYLLTHERNIYSSGEWSLWLLAERVWSEFMDASEKAMGEVMERVQYGYFDIRSMGLLRDAVLAPKFCEEKIQYMQQLLERISNVSDVQVSIAKGNTLQTLSTLLKYRIGVAMWLSGGDNKTNKSKCLGNLLACAKEDPNNGRVYTFIGHYYYMVLKDTSRAMKCYIKALAVNPMDREAGVSLSQIYIENMNDLPKAFKLWADVDDLSSSHAFWCNALSGQLYLYLEQYEEAIISFQKALELETKNVMCWIGLGQCYLHLHQNIASHKSFLKVLELRPDLSHSYVLCGLGEIERRLCMLSSAMQRYEIVLKNDNHHDIIALKGIADVCLAQAYQRYSDGWTQGAARSISRGIECTQRIFDVANINLNTSANVHYDNNTKKTVYNSILKLHSELCCFTRLLGPMEFIQDTLSSNNDKNSVSSYLFRQEDMKSGYQVILRYLEQAEKSLILLKTNYEMGDDYGMDNAIEKVNSDEKEQVDKDILKQEQLDNMVNIWYDIGCAQYYQAMTILLSLGQGSGLFSTLPFIRSCNTLTDVKQFNAKLQSACSSFLYGLKINSKHSKCWNGLGLCMGYGEDGHMASLSSQLNIMSLNRSIQIELNTDAFANISNYYLQRENVALSKRFLNEIQLVESNPLHWESIGIILENSSSSVAAEYAELGRDAANRDSNKMETKQRYMQIYDAYCAATEVAKSAESLLGLSISWMQVNGYMESDGTCIDEKKSIDKIHNLHKIEIRHIVEKNIKLYIRRRPLYPLAWSILVWSLQMRDSHEEVILACQTGLNVLDYITSYLIQCPSALVDENIIIKIYNFACSFACSYERSKQILSSEICTLTQTSLLSVLAPWKTLHDFVTIYCEKKMQFNCNKELGKYANSNTRKKGFTDFFEPFSYILNEYSLKSSVNEITCQFYDAQISIEKQFRLCLTQSQFHEAKVCLQYICECLQSTRDAKIAVSATLPRSVDDSKAGDRRLMVFREIACEIGYQILSWLRIADEETVESVKAADTSPSTGGIPYEFTKRVVIENGDLLLEVIYAMQDRLLAASTSTSLDGGNDRSGSKQVVNDICRLLHWAISVHGNNIHLYFLLFHMEESYHEKLILLEKCFDIIQSSMACIQDVDESSLLYSKFSSVLTCKSSVDHIHNKNVRKDQNEKVPIHHVSSSQAASGCHCHQRLAILGYDVVQAYVNATILYCNTLMQTGTLLSPIVHKRIHKSLLYSPYEVKIWLSFAAVVYFDVVTTVSKNEVKDIENMKQKEEERNVNETNRNRDIGSDLDGIYGRNANEDHMLQLISDIFHYVNVHDSHLLSKAVHSHFYSIVSSNISNQSIAHFKQIAQARNLCKHAKYGESAECYIEAITELKRLIDKSEGLGKDNSDVKYLLPCYRYELAKLYTTMSEYDKAILGYEQICDDADAGHIMHSICLVSISLTILKQVQSQHGERSTEIMNRFKDSILKCKTIPSTIAAAHVISAIFWNELAKPNKVKSELAEALASWKEIFIPSKLK